MKKHRHMFSFLECHRNESIFLKYKDRTTMSVYLEFNPLSPGDVYIYVTGKLEIQANFK